MHLGCGPNVKEGYVNIDGYVTGEGVVNMDILNLGYPDNSADEILAEHLFEHLPFKDEEQLNAIFKPFANYDEAVKDSVSGPSFVCVYAGQKSLEQIVESEESTEEAPQDAS